MKKEGVDEYLVASQETGFAKFINNPKFKKNVKYWEGLHGSVDKAIRKTESIHGLKYNKKMIVNYVCCDKGDILWWPINKLTEFI